MVTTSRSYDERDGVKSTAAAKPHGRHAALQCAVIVSVDYHLDSDDRISFLGGSWAEFARSNGAPDLVDEPLGRSIWDYVDGAAPALLWSELFRRARLTHTVLTVPFRCDSPQERRYLTLAVRKLGGGTLELVTRTQRVETRAVPVAWLESTAKPGNWAISSCSWCRKFEVDGEWLEVEEAVVRLGAFDEAVPAVTHGICPACAVTLRAAM